MAVKWAVIHNVQSDLIKKDLTFSKLILLLRANKSKINLMKKLIAILLVAGAITACNSSESAASGTDSATKAATDTTMKAASDSAVKKMDSTASAVADTAKSKMSAVKDSAKKAIKK